MTDIYFSSWGDQIVDNRGKKVKAFTPVKNVALPESFRQEEKIKGLIGWYGIILRDPDANIIDLCRAYMRAVHENSCGKCIPCRIGTRIMADTLARICAGDGHPDDLQRLQELCGFISSSSKCHIGQSGPKPIGHALKYFHDDFQKAVSQPSPIEEGAYHSKLTAPCMDACPIHLDIPTYVGHIREGRFLESLDVIRCRLPIPGVVGRVCFRPCEKHCRRANLDEPISIKYLKRFVADVELGVGKTPSYEITPSEKTGKVAIVGAGPAGVTCAFHLAQKGHKVTIYEHLDAPGGMSYVGIPDYRLPPSILRGEVEQVQKLGVEIKYNTTVGKDVTLAELEENNDAVFVGIGAHKGTSMWVEGEDEGYKGFISGVEFLLDTNQGRIPYPEGKRVVVVGGGNVAIDCVRSAFRVEKTDVTLLYRRTKKEMPADPVEILDAEEEHVKFEYLVAPKRIVAENHKVVGLECLRMKLGEPDASGRRRPVPIEGSEFVIDCDIIIPAIGQTMNLSLLEGVEGIETTRWNSLVVDEVTKQTARPKIFSAGDCETGPAALITACAGGRKAAFSIDRLINGLPLELSEEDHYDQLFKSVKVYDPDEKVDVTTSKARHQLDMLEPETRKFTFDEVEQGFETPAAIAEAERCLRCYCVATIAV